jgi:release factor glutamine methyltransferase
MPHGQAVCTEGVSVRQALRWAVRLLAAREIESPRLDAEVLLAHVLDTERSRLPLHWDDCLTAEQAHAYNALIQRRLAREPVAYLIGRRPFYDVDLVVNPHVLIPRPETEHLVEEALGWAQARQGPLRIADVGTGSGAIAIVLARHLPQSHVWAIDISREALAVASLNATRYDLVGRITFLQGDLLAPLAGTVDLVAANLPYVRREELPELMADVRDYEPEQALVGGLAGLDLIERIMPQLAEHLARPGLALLEIDPRQAEAVRRLAQQHLPDAAVSVVSDYAGLERVVRVERGEA